MAEPAIAILGAGSWGTALAWLLGGKGLRVRLWCRDPERAAAIASTRVNSRYLPELRLPDPVEPTAELDAAVRGAGLVVIAVPAQVVRATLEAARSALPPAAPLVLAAKGLEQGTGLRLSQVAAEVLGEAIRVRLAVLSGPNLSGEIVRGIPTASVVAAPRRALACRVQETFGTPFFRIYANRDLAGVEFGGALKNPIAIAAGISDGLGFGANTRASLLTRGLAEMTRLGVAAGARRATFGGLSGLGDLVATAHSPLSRNYRLGVALGRGAPLEAALASLGQVAEGVATTEAACRLAARLGVEVPIMAELRRVLFEGRLVAEAVAALMARPYREE